MKRSTYIGPAKGKELNVIVANDLLDMVVLGEANFDHVPSVKEFIVKYATARHTKTKGKK